ncbi:MAG: hypothetical protein O7D32_00750 [bacterium]|nr:hypothetical protein [bacterium]
MRSLLISILCLALAGPASALVYKTKKAIIGQSPYKAVPGSPSQSLQMFYSDSGRLFLSVDALGTDLSAGSIQVERPEGGTVRRAFLVAASTGFSGYEIRDGDVSVDGTAVVWYQAVPNSIRSWNALADVTALVKPRLDVSSAAGRVPVQIEETNTHWIDGVILIVVFDDPNEWREKDISLFFGAHAVDGDRFTITMAKPITHEHLLLELGVGISFGMQTSKAEEQYSVISVNGNRLTSAAGGPDDGSPSIGALITVGGLDDDSTNPMDAFAPVVNLVSDDEYYDLRPFVRPGDNQIEIETRNPSKDENLLFASFVAAEGSADAPSRVSKAGSESDIGTMAGVGMLGGAAAIGTPIGVSGGAGGTGGGAVLVPGVVSGRTFDHDSDTIVLDGTTGASRVGEETRVTTRVVDIDGDGLPGIDVRLKVIGGPHAGAVTQSRTDERGEAVFLYRGVSSGTDSLMAMVSYEEGRYSGSNIIEHEWRGIFLTGYLDINPGTCPNSVSVHTEEVSAALMGLPGFDVNEIEVGSLYLENVAPVRFSFGDLGRPGDQPDCPCSEDSGDGVDDLLLYFKTADLVDELGYANGTPRPITLTGRLKNGDDFEATNCVVLTNGEDAPQVPNNNILAPITTETIDDPGDVGNKE